MPFIHKMLMLEELVTLRDMRAIVKEQFKKYKDVTDPRVGAAGPLGGAARSDARACRRMQPRPPCRTFPPAAGH
jgi:hypothetical protein